MSSTRLDQILGKRKPEPSPEPEPRRLTGQIEQAILCMRIERVLMVQVRNACLGQKQTLRAIEQVMTDGGSQNELQAGIASMTMWRENLSKALADYTAFAVDPTGWLAEARQSGRLQSWARFGIA